MGRVRLTRAAKDDLEHIRHFTVQEWGAQQADRYLAAIHRKLTLLAGNPRMSPRIFPESAYRAATHQQHRILYRVADDAIEIARVLHQAQDISRAIEHIQQRRALRERTREHQSGKGPDEPDR